MAGEWTGFSHSLISEGLATLQQQIGLENSEIQQPVHQSLSSLSE